MIGNVASIWPIAQALSTFPTPKVPKLRHHGIVVKVTALESLNLGTEDWLCNLGQVPQACYTCFAFLKIIIYQFYKVFGSLKCTRNIVMCSVSVDLMLTTTNTTF